MFTTSQPRVPPQCTEPSRRVEGEDEHANGPGFPGRAHPPSYCEADCTGHLFAPKTDLHYICSIPRVAAIELAVAPGIVSQKT